MGQEQEATKKGYKDEPQKLALAFPFLDTHEYDVVDIKETTRRSGRRSQQSKDPFEEEMKALDEI